MGVQAVSPGQKTRRRPRPLIDVKGRPGGGYLQWVQVRHPTEERIIRLQARWNIYGLPVGVIVAPLNMAYLGKFVVLSGHTKAALPWNRLPRCVLVTSAYELDRQAGHITEQYAEEADALSQARQIAVDANQAALTSVVACVEEHETILAALFVDFDKNISARVRDEDKVVGRRQMEAARSLTDKLGRFNRAVAATRTRAAVGRVVRRSESVFGIRPRIGKRRIVAQGLTAFAEEFVIEPLAKLMTSVLFLGTGGALTSPAVRASLIARCSGMVIQCRAIDWRPHHGIALRLASELDDAIVRLQEGKVSAALSVFSRIKEVLDLQAAQRQLRSMLVEFRPTHDTVVSAEQITTLAKQLRAMIPVMDQFGPAALPAASKRRLVAYLASAGERLLTVKPPVRLRRGLSDKQLDAVVSDLREASRLF